MQNKSALRPSLRDLARLAGISVMSVSRALRNQPKVSPEIRARVLQLADQLGYRPDPEVSKLMTHLRNRRKLAFQGLICALCNRPKEAENHYIARMIEGARRTAEVQGFSFSVVPFSSGQGPSLRRMLRARDVQGVLILPLREPAELGSELGLAQLPAVCATSSVLSPNLPSVTPHHLANTFLLCRELSERGYRRIGLVTDVSHDLRVNHAFTAAVTWHGLYGGAQFVQPLIHDGLQATGLKAWFERETPDVIVTSTHPATRKIATLLQLEIPGPIGFASTSTERESGIAGIDELPREIGAAATDMLTAMIQHRQRGTPIAARNTALHGSWLEGNSCPRKPASSLSPKTPNARSTRKRAG